MTSLPHARSAGRRWFGGLGRNEDLWLLALLIALALFFTGLLGPRFLSPPVIRSMAFQLPELGILSLAMMITLLSGGINLAVIASAVLSGIVTALVLTRLVPPELAADPPLVLVIAAIAAGVSGGTATGLLNGFLISRVGVSPILATLGSMTLIQGLNLFLTGGRSISGMPATLRVLAEGAPLGVPAPLVLFTLAATAMAVILARTPFGIEVTMIGSNEPAARLAGVETKRVIMRVYVVSGFLAGLAGVLMLARFNSINASFGQSYLLVTLLAAVLGGVNPFGGFGRVRGLVLALAILQVVSSGLNMLHLSAHVTLAIWGALLLAVMGVRVWLGRSAV